ncbi:MAG: beta-N-acetylhexosaminidase [Deltaproteobacteria bacterium]|nr:beta-N-acetylhexosaminidase [Deltaproteobacteria bacterium]
MITGLLQLLGLISSLILGQAGPISDRVEKILGQMSVEQKVGQLMMVGFGGKQMGPEIAKLLIEHHIGSVAIYSRNITGTKQLAKLVRDVREVMREEIQPFVAIDQEGGNVVRVRSDVLVLPGAMALGATRDPVLAFLAGQANAIDLGLLGVDMNLAPVLDVNRNPRNPVINIRAYGDHPKLVTELGTKFIQGQQQAGMATVAKHFPGHGTTSNDSHFALPVISLSLEQLKQTELIPFRAAIDTGLDAIMTAHVQVPAVDPSGSPASLSHAVISELLRKELKFDGLVITDDLEMRAIAERMTSGEAAVQAILAGADIVMVIWTAHKKHEVYEALLQAVKQNKIQLTRIDESVRRILRLKATRGTLDALVTEKRELSKLFPNKLHARLVQTIAYRAVTLVRNRNSIVPLCDGKNVLAVGPQRIFLNELKRLLPGSRILITKRVPSQKRRREDLEKIVSLSKGKQAVVVAVVNAYQAWLVQQLKRRIKVPIVAVSFSSPYFFRNFPSVDAYICTYSYLPSAQVAAARAISGQISVTGRLPVKISKQYKRGHGHTIKRKSCSASATR